MAEFPQANWLWLLVGIGILWFLFRRGGCGMGGPDSHEVPGGRANEEERKGRWRAGCH